MRERKKERRERNIQVSLKRSALFLVREMPFLGKETFFHSRCHRSFSRRLSPFLSLSLSLPLHFPFSSSFCVGLHRQRDLSLSLSPLPVFLPLSSVNFPRKNAPTHHPLFLLSPSLAVVGNFPRNLAIRAWKHPCQEAIKTRRTGGGGSE